MHDSFFSSKKSRIMIANLWKLWTINSREGMIIVDKGVSRE